MSYWSYRLKTFFLQPKEVNHVPAFWLEKRWWVFQNISSYYLRTGKVFNEAVILQLAFLFLVAVCDCGCEDCNCKVKFFHAFRYKICLTIKFVRAFLYSCMSSLCQIFNELAYDYKHIKKELEKETMAQVVKQYLNYFTNNFMETRTIMIFYQFFSAKQKRLRKR